MKQEIYYLYMQNRRIYQFYFGLYVNLRKEKMLQQKKTTI